MTPQSHDPPNVPLRAYRLDDPSRPLDWETVRTWKPADGPIWIHLDATDPQADHWIRKDAHLEATICDALLAEDTRPRFDAEEEGLLVILRGVNLDPGADPEDMVAIRMWADSGRLITLTRRHVQAVEDLVASLARPRAPRTVPDLLARLTARVVARVDPALDSIDDALAELEDRVGDDEIEGLHTRLGELRRRVVTFWRHLAPQREMLARLSRARIDLISDDVRESLEETANILTRYLEILRELRDRAMVTQDELHSRLSEQLNRRMLLLAVVTVIFLPLSLVTGLLGINVAGIPGARSDVAFLVVCLVLAVVVVFELVVLKRAKWF